METKSRHGSTHVGKKIFITEVNLWRNRQLDKYTEKLANYDRTCDGVAYGDSQSAITGT